MYSDSEIDDAIKGDLTTVPVAKMLKQLMRERDEERTARKRAAEIIDDLTKILNEVRLESMT